MKPLHLSWMASVLGLCALTLASADQVLNDNQIVQGGFCVGQDCVNGEVFNEDTLKLKENNLRIRFIDLTAADALGKSWIIETNDSANEGDSYFDVRVKSVERDVINAFSDGTNVIPLGCPNAGEIIPAGEPLLIVSNDGVCVVDGEFTVESRMRIMPATSGAVAIGAEAEVVDGAVSVGKAGMLRQLKNVAQGLAATDALIKQTLDDYNTPLSVQRDTLADLSAEIDALEAALTSAEMLVTAAENLPAGGGAAVGGGGGGGGLGLGWFGALGLLLLGGMKRVLKPS
jgi:hypothetical protein